MTALLQLNDRDNVCIALQKMLAGSEVEGLRILDEIPSGHKVAIQQIEKDAAIVKYGQVIGFASEPIGPGQHVHSHNVMVHTFEREHNFGSRAREPTLWKTQPPLKAFTEKMVEWVKELRWNSNFCQLLGHCCQSNCCCLF